MNDPLQLFLIAVAGPVLFASLGAWIGEGLSLHARNREQTDLKPFIADQSSSGLATPGREKRLRPRTDELSHEGRGAPSTPRSQT